MQLGVLDGLKLNVPLSILLESYCNLVVARRLRNRHIPLSILLESYCNYVAEMYGVNKRRAFNSPRVLLQRRESTQIGSRKSPLSILLESYCNSWGI
ncbi:protein of unknown function [Thermococcus nautili]|nr:protein of unknown function [Thermococcus nautili]